MLQYGYKIGKLDYDKEKYKEMILDASRNKKSWYGLMNVIVIAVLVILDMSNLR